MTTLAPDLSGAAPLVRELTALGSAGPLAMAPLAILACSADFEPECVSSCTACTQLTKRHSCSHSVPRDPPPRLHGNTSDGVAVRWLHIPKCGSTLAISILSYACTPMLPDWHINYMALAGGQVDIRMAHAIDARFAVQGSRCDGRLWLPLVGHDPVDHAREITVSMSGALVHAASLSPRGGGLAAMFRQPSQRLISAFLDNFHAFGVPPKSRQEMKSRASTVDRWARWPGIASCQTKMLLGMACAAPVPEGKGAQMLVEASKLLRSDAFVFVGIQEQWERSICLFHATLGRGTSPMISELEDLGHSHNSNGPLSLRRTSRGCRLRSSSGECFDTSNIANMYNESVLGGWRDELDEALYAVAIEVFHANLARYGLG